MLVSVMFPAFPLAELSLGQTPSQPRPLPLCVPSASCAPTAGHNAKDNFLLWLVGLGFGWFSCLIMCVCWEWGLCVHVSAGGCGFQKKVDPGAGVSVGVENLL